MDKVILPFLFVAVAAGLFFSYIRPAYEALLAFREQEARIDSTLSRAKDLRTKVDALIIKKGIIDAGENKFRLNTLLPNNLNVVHIVIQVDALVRQSGMIIDDFTLPQTSGSVAEPGVVAWADFGITCTGSYADLQDLLTRMEYSLTLMDITRLTIATGGAMEDVSHITTAPMTAQPSYKIEFRVPYMASI